MWLIMNILMIRTTTLRSQEFDSKHWELDFTVSFSTVLIVLSQEGNNELVRWFDRPFVHSTNVYTRQMWATWGGSRRVVALKKTTVESRPVSRVGPSGGRETF